MTAAHIMPQAEIETELAAQGTPMQNISNIMQEKHFGGDQDNEEVMFKWQEKFFSQVGLTDICDNVYIKFDY